MPPTEPKDTDLEEPRIEEEKKEAADDKEEEKVAAGDDDKEEGEANSASMLEDVSENFQAAIQLLGDFITGSLGGCSQRKELVANLLIDTHIRFGDASMFREDILGAVEQYQAAVELCREFPMGNERNEASTLFTIGCCLQ